MCSLLVNCFPASQSLVTTDLFPIHITLPFHKCHIINSYNMWIFASSILLSAKWIFRFIFLNFVVVYTHTQTYVYVCVCNCSTIFWNSFLKWQLFLHWNDFALWPKSYWLYWCEFISGLFIVFHSSMAILSPIPAWIL